MAKEVLLTPSILIERHWKELQERLVGCLRLLLFFSLDSSTGRPVVDGAVETIDYSTLLPLTYLQVFGSNMYEAVTDHCGITIAGRNGCGECENYKLSTSYEEEESVRSVAPEKPPRRNRLTRQRSRHNANEGGSTHQHFTIRSIHRIHRFLLLNFMLMKIIKNSLW